MDTPESTRAAMIAAVDTKTQLVAVAMALPEGRKRSAAWRAVDLADRAVTFAAADHERAVRVSMPGASEAEIMAVALSA